MLAAMRLSLQSFQTCEEASGSSMAQSTMSTPSRSHGSKLRSICVICFWATRNATSSFNPEAGQTTVTRASALRVFRMRPAATYRKYVDQHQDAYSCQSQLLTSPPPTTNTCLSFICQARINEPPPCTSGNFDMVVDDAANQLGYR
jgi:hypothetical protein